MKIYFYLTTVLILLCFLIAGCDSEDLPEKGTCKVKVTGYLNKSFDGEAVFEDIPGLGGRTIFFLELRNVEKPGEKYQVVRFINGSKPGAGRYSLNPDDSTLNKIKVEYSDSEVEGIFKPNNGTLEIKYTNEEILKGWCDFTAETSVTRGGGVFQKINIRVIGEFYAEGGDVGIILD